MKITNNENFFSNDIEEHNEQERNAGNHMIIPDCDTSLGITLRTWYSANLDNSLKGRNIR